MAVTGTGRAPFYAFIQHISEEEGAWKGQVRLLFGAKTDLDLSYMNDVEDDVSRHQLESTLYET